MRPFIASIVLLQIPLVHVLVLDGAKDVPCDLNVGDISCPDGYCCARDEYFFKDTYCKPFGKVGDHCVTRVSAYNCPCEKNLYCKPNLVSHLTVLFGTCQQNTSVAAQTTTSTSGTTAITASASNVTDTSTSVSSSVGPKSASSTTGTAVNQTTVTPTATQATNGNSSTKPYSDSGSGLVG